MSVEEVTPRELEFTDKVASIVNEYRDLTRGVRSMYLITAGIALVAAEGGKTFLSLREYARVMAVFAKNLFKNGLLAELPENLTTEAFVEMTNDLKHELILLGIIHDGTSTQATTQARPSTRFKN